MATLLLGPRVPNVAATWRSGMREVLPLPCSNFRESARALAQDDLLRACYLIEKVWEFDEIYRGDYWPPRSERVDIPEAIFAATAVDRYPANISLICWWSLWRDFPVALALYEHELLMTVKAHNQPGQTGIQGRYFRDLSTAVYRCGRRLREADVPPASKLARKIIKEVEWLGDERLHSCHRSYLTHSNRKWYGQYGWRDPNIKLRVDQTVKRTTLFDHVGVAMCQTDYGLPMFAYEFWFPDSVVEFAECVRYEHPGLLRAGGLAVPV